MLACIDAPEGNVEGHGGAAARRLKELTPLGATIRLWSLVQEAGAVVQVSCTPVAGPSTQTPIASWLPKGRLLFIRSTSANAIARITGGSRSGLVCSVAVFSAMGIFYSPWNTRRGYCPDSDKRGLKFWWDSLWMNPWKM